MSSTHVVAIVGISVAAVAIASVAIVAINQGGKFRSKYEDEKRKASIEVDGAQ